MEYVSNSSSLKNRRTEAPGHSEGMDGECSRMKTVSGPVIALLILLTLLIAWDVWNVPCRHCPESAGADIRNMACYCGPHAERLPWPGAALLFFQPLDINQASMEELALLRGVGEKGAAALLNFRMGRGFLLSVNEIDSINGPLCHGRFENLKNHLTISPCISPGSCRESI